jgi:subtilisin-like proprotein convertase family protein
MMRYLYTFLLAVLIAFSGTAQKNHWQTFDEANILLPQRSEVSISAKRYQTLALDFDALRADLAGAPMEFTAAAKTQAIQLYLPLPNGEMELMQVVESPVMAPELAAKFPAIKTYAARSVNNKTINARFDFSPYGFNATIVTPEGRAFISPYASEQTHYYISYYSKDEQIDVSSLPSLSCGFDDFATEDELDYQQQEILSQRTDLSFRNAEAVPLRTYRMALACTGEYGQSKGGTVEAVMATYTTTLNIINQIFQLEFSARFELIPGNEVLIFLDPNTDPYVNSNVGGQLLGQNTGVINTYFSPEQYDIGHVFTMGCTDVGGVAGGTICSANKARGVTCHYTNLNNIVRGVMAHEIGHQFSCGHSWNNCPGSEDQLSSANAFEPGSGSTIMSYQGACGPLNNLPFPSGDYYNIGSLEDFIFFSRQGSGSACGASTITENTQPEINIPLEDDFWIPISTPFELDVEAEDADGDALTYCWEQYDLGPNVNLGNPILNSPLFRSFPPRSASNRVFPDMSKIVNEAYDVYEVLPTYERDLTFKVTVRDNNPDHGGVVWDDVAFKSDATAGPFRVTQPNTVNDNWKVGEYREVTWNVANTDNSRVKCNYVDIRLSTDGGFTYPITLVEGTPNDGSAFVTVPDALSPQARIRVEAANNIFFDISDEDFNIEEATEPGFTLDIAPVAVPLYCYPSSEGITIDINSASLLGYDSTLTLSLEGDLPAYVNAAFAESTLTPGDATTLSLDFEDFTGRDTLDLQVRATTPSEEIALRDLRIITLSNDFSELEQQTPTNGQDGIVFTTDFSWTAVSAANTYEIQIATSPSFDENTIVETANGITSGEYIPEVIFDVNEIYFWRIRPINDCGPGEYLAPYAFQTSTVDCLPNAPQDLPIALPNNPTTKISTIFVPTSGTISDVNIDELQLSYQPLNSLRISLVSPAGTEVILFDQNCLNTGLLNISFDDEAPTDIICPPISGNPMRPENPLSTFDGEDTQGEWELKVRIVSPGFGGGSINSWNVEFCATVENPAPSLIRNETLPVPPGEGNLITTDFLEVQDGVSTATGVKYTLMTVPANGQLYRAGDTAPLQQGETFTQETINAFNLSYVHDGTDTNTDQFRFIVENEAGGWIPNQTFNIEIDEDATVNTNNQSFDNTLNIFPNPAKDKVAIQFTKPMTGNINIRILNLQGQEVSRYEYDGIDAQIQLSTASLASGIYFIAVEGDAGKITRKLAVQR